MKKIKLLFLVPLTISFLGSCSLFSSTITIYDANKTLSFEAKAKSGEQVKVEALTKPGKFLVGYFSEEVGGTKYFDSEGYSLNNWSRDNPATFYAQYDDIANLPECSFEFEGVPSNDYSWTNSTGFLFRKTLEGKAFLNAARGNTNLTIKTAYSLNARGHCSFPYYASRDAGIIFYISYLNAKKQVVKSPHDSIVINGEWDFYTSAGTFKGEDFIGNDVKYIIETSYKTRSIDIRQGSVSFTIS